MMETSKRFTFLNNNVDHALEINKLEVIIPEIVDPQYGMFTWPSAPVLAQYLFHHQHIIRRKTVLELGSGTSLAGVVAAKLGGCVTLSDAKQYTNCLQNCRKSCIANGLNDVNIIPLTWGKVTPELIQLKNIDFIIASDCFYDKTDFEDILFTVAFILKENPHAVFLTTYQVRDCNLSIEELLYKWQLKCIEIPLAEFNADNANNLICGDNMSAKHLIQMFQISK